MQLMHLRENRAWKRALGYCTEGGHSPEIIFSLDNMKGVLGTAG